MDLPGRLRQPTQQHSSSVAREGWSAALDTEIMFWDEWFRTKGWQWPEGYQVRVDPRLPMDESVRRFVDWLPQKEIRILDVGAGPFTVIGRVHPSKKLTIVAVDALAKAL